MRSAAATHHAKPRVLFLVENLPVPTDRRVWHEALTLRDAGFEVSVVAPQWHFPRRFEQLQGINVYRFPMPSLGGIGGHPAGCPLPSPPLVFHSWGAFFS